MIYLTSDLHLCHNRPFLYEPRGYSSIYQMNEDIVSNWNSIVNTTDEVYVLGDLMLNDNDAGIKFLKQLKGDIHIIRGNHDTDPRIELYNQCYNVVEVCNSTYLKCDGFHFYLSHYPTLTSTFDIEKRLYSRLINLCGHTHTSDPFLDWDRYNAPIYHCELDAHHNAPVSIDQIIFEIRNH